MHNPNEHGTLYRVFFETKRTICRVCGGILRANLSVPCSLGGALIYFCRLERVLKQSFIYRTVIFLVVECNHFTRFCVNKILRRQIKPILHFLRWGPLPPKSKTFQFKFSRSILFDAASLVGGSDLLLSQKMAWCCFTNSYSDLPIIRKIISYYPPNLSEIFSTTPALQLPIPLLHECNDLQGGSKLNTPYNIQIVTRTNG